MKNKPKIIKLPYQGPTSEDNELMSTLDARDALKANLALKRRYNKLINED